MISGTIRDFALSGSDSNHSIIIGDPLFRTYTATTGSV